MFQVPVYRFFYGDFELDFKGNNVLVYGENGSGKSSVYRALEFLTKNKFRHRVQYAHHLDKHPRRLGCACFHTKIKNFMEKMGEKSLHAVDARNAAEFCWTQEPVETIGRIITSNGADLRERKQSSCVFRRGGIPFICNCWGGIYWMSGISGLL